MSKVRDKGERKQMRGNKERLCTSRTMTVEICVFPSRDRLQITSGSERREEKWEEIIIIIMIIKKKKMGKKEGVEMCKWRIICVAVFFSSLSLYCLPSLTLPHFLPLLTFLSISLLLLLLFLSPSSNEGLKPKKESLEKLKEEVMGVKELCE